MAATTALQDLSNSILKILADEPEKRWTVAQLCKEVAKDTGCTNNKRIDLMIRTMVASGTVHGQLTRTGAAHSIRFCKPDDSGMATSKTAQARIKALEEGLAAAEEQTRKFAAAAAQATEALKEERAKGTITEVHLKQAGKVIKKTKGIFHRKFQRMLDLADERENIMLYGPTGSGKTFVGSQTAEVLKQPFSFISCTTGMSEGRLEGKRLPHGPKGQFEYITSEFIRRYEGGGVFLLDEIDAADPNVLLFINSALSGDEIAIENRTEKPTAKRHKDFICIATCNTLGGADRQYSGRNKLDNATLDRFAIGKVYIDYDRNLEQQLVEDELLLKFCWNIRRAIDELRLERAMSTRFILRAHNMMKNKKWSVGEVFGTEDGFFSGWAEDEVHKVKACMQNYRGEDPTSGDPAFTV